MTQLEALKIAYNELSNMMPYGDENDEIFKAAEVIERMIRTKETQSYKQQLKNSLRNKVVGDYLRGRVDGYNACIDEILGGTDGKRI